MGQASALPIEISPAETQNLLKSNADSVALIDCREPSEYETASIDGSILIPMSDWGQFEGYRKSLVDKRVIVHCHHGGRSLRVASWMRQNGFPDAQSMAGGIDQWSLEIDSSVPRY